MMERGVHLGSAVLNGELKARAGSLYEDLIDAQARMSPEEVARYVDRLRDLVERFQGPGGP